MTKNRNSSETNLNTAKPAAQSVQAELEKVAVSAPVFRQVKKLIVLVIGGTILLLGIALLVLPGPAFLVIPAGLAILGLEFAWARRWLRKAREVIKDPKAALRKGLDRDPPAA